MRLRLYQIVYRAQPGDTISHIYDIFIVAVAFISVFPFMFKESSTSPEIKMLFNIIDVVTVYILFCDYVLRWITYDVKTGKGWKSFLLYPLNPIAIIDLLAILPSVTVLNDGLKFLRVLRIVRILRMSKGLVILTNVFRKEAKPLISVVFFIFVYIFATALIMFNVEPNMFDHFLEALYWSSTSLATIGYGDITPQSNIGQVIMMISSILGIAVIAFPAGIITGGYLTQIKSAESEGESYFYEGTTTTKTFTGRRPQDYCGLADYFKSNRKVRIYLIYICIGIFVNISTTYIQLFTEPIVFFNEFGSILIAIILEPAAGLIVGLVCDLFWAIALNSASDMLFYGNTVIYIVLFSVFCRRGKKITLKNVVIIFVVGIFAPSILTFTVSFFSTDSIDYYNNFYNLVHTISFENNLNIFLVAAIALVLINSCYLIIDFVGILLVRRFLYGAKYDPMMLLDKKERYKFKIYSDATNKNEYIEDWTEDEEEKDWEDIAKIGKTSIVESKEKVEASQDRIKELEKKIEEYEEKISKHQSLVVEEQQEIDVKKKAVRKAVRKSMSDSD